MKLLVLLILSLTITMAESAECAQGSTPLCFCSSSSTENPNCDITEPIAHTDHSSSQDCEAYCQSECGPGAGSSFSCQGGEPLTPCNAGDYCRCGCAHKAYVPSGIRFSGQCNAFCDREDVCDVNGVAMWKCEKYGSPIFTADTSNGGRSRATFWALLVVTTAATVLGIHL